MMMDNMGSFGWIFMLVFWALVIVGLISVVKLLFDKTTSAEKNSLEILKDRYARGEIELEEFEQKKRDLKN